ncbi:MAG: DUF1566 domain-containing protein [Proteobacteria bacterium]|nr:DUF1566 domain-containing protein [Pseudomonadota bacterium]
MFHRKRYLFLFVVIATGFTACYESNDPVDDDSDTSTGTDGDTDTDSDSDTDTDADTDADTDTDTDTDEPPFHSPMTECGVGKYDPETKLCWQTWPNQSTMLWQEAIDFCDELTKDNHIDWRLPNIDELRSLIRGCPETETGGGCTITDESEREDWSELCMKCSGNSPPGSKGCYWDAALKGSCDTTSYWSSSYLEEEYNAEFDNYAAVSITFFNGLLYYNNSDSYSFVRCVRDGP